MLSFLELGKSFLRDEYRTDEEKEEMDDEEIDVSKKIQRLKKRLQVFRERELTRELDRVGQPICNNE